MDHFRTMFGGGQANLADAPESVLGEWQKYSSDAAPPTQSDRLLGQMEAGGATLTNAFSSSLSAARTGISSAGATISGGATSATSLCAHLKIRFAIASPMLQQNSMCTFQSFSVKWSARVIATVLASSQSAPCES